MLAKGEKGIIHCVECLDVPANVECVQCRDFFCLLCFQWLHKKGKRNEHQTVDLKQKIPKSQLTGRTSDFLHMYEEEEEKIDEDVKKFQKTKETTEKKKKKKKSTKKTDDKDEQMNEDEEEEEINYSDGQKRNFIELLKYTPLRLNEVERKLLRLLEGALEISEYTDKVDVSHSDYGMISFGWGYSSRFTQPQTSSSSKEKIIKHQLKELFSLLSGLYTSSNYRAGVQLVEDKNFADNEEFFQQVFEVGRRFKIMNPDKFRSVYGKLMHILQDAVSPKYINFNVLLPIRCVYTLLEERKCLDQMMKDLPDWMVAAKPISSSKNVDILTAKKNAAQSKLLSKYQKKLSEGEILLCIHSIGDCFSYITDNTHAVCKMIEYLRHYFDPNNEKNGSLALSKGKNGSCLSHNHSTQFQFVLQSLLLWREIQKSMYKLWSHADKDLLEKNNQYRLSNTGQGLNRVQAAPTVSNSMHHILSKVKSMMNGWVGLSVVHLGDRDVPNALIFIDKYTQVPWILNPIVQTIENIGTLHNNDPNIRLLIDSKFGGVEDARKMILQDFFKHGFDGSGDDGGSCIDGRLTSAWNWCSLLEKKSFYHLFMVCGFEGFNGSYRR